MYVNLSPSSRSVHTYVAFFVYCSFRCISVICDLRLATLSIHFLKWLSLTVDTIGCLHVYRAVRTFFKGVCNG